MGTINANMLQTHVEKISGELRVATRWVAAAIGLLDGGATVPFITRYRKEATDNLDEVAVTRVRDRLEQLRDLDQRRATILASLEERELLTPELAARINAAESMAVLEDIYLPYRPKRRTRATIAREKGLEPLAEILWRQDGTNPTRAAASYVDPETGVETAEDALSGARDIMAEWVSEDATARAGMRQRFLAKGIITSKVADGRPDQATKYRDYYDWQEPVAAVTSHRLLAMLRGERESMLTVHVQPEEEEALFGLEGLFVKGDGLSSQQMRLAVHDGYKRLLSSSMETETRKVIKQRADETAIRVFASNLRQLLLAPALGEKNVPALDPGFRTGCKLVCLDRQGKLLHRETIYPLLDQRRAQQAGHTAQDLCRKFEIEAIAVGNGTGGRETEAFLRTLDLGSQIPVVMVNESGASIYSASEVARAEFPHEDLTVRGAVSIGRCLMAPLAKLVKIDPKSIGVGQYQHDVDQKALKSRLDDVAVVCVNRVGVAVNTASAQLLAYVSGLGPSLAQAIVKYRDENGPFRSRESLKKVPRLGPKAFEQAAGFLRIRGGSTRWTPARCTRRATISSRPCPATPTARWKTCCTTPPCGNKSIRRGMSAKELVCRPWQTSWKSCPAPAGTRARNSRPSTSTRLCGASGTLRLGCVYLGLSPTSPPSGPLSTLECTRTDWCTSASWPTGSSAIHRRWSICSSRSPSPFWRWIWTESVSRYP